MLQGLEPKLGLVDRYLARNIAVPLIGTLILAAMLLVLGEDAAAVRLRHHRGRPGQRRVADARQSAARIFLARHPDRPDARNPARLSQACA